LCLPAIGFALGEAGGSWCHCGKYFWFRLVRVRTFLVDKVMDIMVLKRMKYSDAKTEQMAF